MIIPSKEEMKASLAKYLPLSGGTMSGVIYADNSKAAYVGDDGSNGIQLRFVSGVTDTFAKVNGGDINLQAKVAPGKVTYQSYVNLSVNDGVSIGAPNTANNKGVTINDVVTPTTDDMATNKKYVDDAVSSVRTKAHKVTLSASGWDSSAKTQTVSCADVVADETAQQILPMPAAASMSAYNDAGILCTGQGAGTLTFTADTVPTSDISVYVTITPVQFS